MKGAEEARGLLEEEERKEIKEVISGVTLRLEEGKLLAVVGRVGSGKSSLLAKILGET